MVIAAILGEIGVHLRDCIVLGTEAKQRCEGLGGSSPQLCLGSLGDPRKKRRYMYI